MYLVLDIGGTFIKYALMDGKGTIQHKSKHPISRDHLEQFKEVLFHIIESQDLDTIRGIAVSCPGTIDVKTGMIYYGGSFRFLHEVNLTEIIYQRYNKPVSIENDAKCAALAELWLGSVKGLRDSVVLVLGSGIGGGIIIDGKIRHGAHLSAGEVSYMMSGIQSTTAEAQFFGLECSAVEMIRKIGTLKQLDDSTNGEAVFEYINNGDPEAQDIFDTYCLNVAVQIYNLQYVLDPERFAIGGGISVQPIVLERIQEAVNKIKKQNPFHIADPQVVACTFRNDANLYGALYHFLVEQGAQLSQNRL